MFEARERRLSEAHEDVCEKRKGVRGHLRQHARRLAKTVHERTDHVESDVIARLQNVNASSKWSVTSSARSVCDQDSGYRRACAV